MGSRKSLRDVDAPDSLIEGTAKDDELFGADADDQIFGYEGWDHLRGKGGNDEMYGGTGDDALFGGAGDDWLFGEGGGDIMSGGKGNDILEGGDGRDSLWGDEGVDLLVGGAGDDMIIDNGHDLLYDGGRGVDKLALNNNPALSGYTIDLSLTTAQFIYEGSTQGVVISGFENVNGTIYDDVITGNGADNEFITINGNDTLNGGGGDDSLYAGVGHDILNGGAGDDFLVGGAGKNVLAGGAGADVFLLERAVAIQANVETVLDFRPGQDVLWLNNGLFTGFGFDQLGFNEIFPELFVANATGTAQDADDFLVYNTTNGKLFYDPDGNGAGKAELFAVIGVDSHPALTASDFFAVAF